MQGVFRILAAISFLLSAFVAQAQNTQKSSVIETDEGKYFTTLQRNDRGMFMDITPADKDDNSISRRIPSDCPECGQDCLMPPLFRWESDPHIELGGGGLTISVENPTRCVRIDGLHSKRDSAVHLLVTNGREEKYRVGVLESGELLIERDVLPGERLEEQLVPLGDRRYSFSISAYPNQAKELPTQIGFGVYRYEFDSEPIQSLVMFNIGAGQ